MAVRHNSPYKGTPERLPRTYLMNGKHSYIDQRDRNAGVDLFDLALRSGRAEDFAKAFGEEARSFEEKDSPNTARSPYYRINGKQIARDPRLRELGSTTVANGLPDDAFAQASRIRGGGDFSMAYDHGLTVSTRAAEPSAHQLAELGRAVEMICAMEQEPINA
jgi:hypothetical protein